jgi:hypothetical protein
MRREEWNNRKRLKFDTICTGNRTETEMENGIRQFAILLIRI